VWKAGTAVDDGEFLSFQLKDGGHDFALLARACVAVVVGYGLYPELAKIEV
jgi:hypothetical protein